MREGRIDEADVLRRAREAALAGSVVATGGGAAPGGAAAGVPDSARRRPDGASGVTLPGPWSLPRTASPAGPARSGRRARQRIRAIPTAEPPERP